MGGNDPHTHTPFGESPHLFYLLFSCSVFGINSFLGLYNSRFIIEEWYCVETAESREAVFFSSAALARANNSVLCNIETITGQ